MFTEHEKRKLFFRYGLAIIAAMLPLPFLPMIEGPAHALPLFISVGMVATSALFAGLVPGLVTTTLTIAGMSYLYLPPFHSLLVTDPLDAHHIAIFSLIALFISWFGGWVRTRLEKMESSKKRFEFLYRSTSAVFAKGLSLARRIEILSQIAIPDFADWCIIEILEKNGSIQRFPVAFADPRNADLAWRLTNCHSHPLSSFSVSKVIRTGMPILVENFTPAIARNIAGTEEYYKILLEIHPKTYVIAPIRSESRIFGAIAFLSTKSDRRYKREDLAVVEELAYRAAAALESAELYDDLQQAVHVRDDLMAFVSHDLKNPVTAVKLNVSLLERIAKSQQLNEHAERVLQAISGIKRSIDSADRLIHNLLDVSKIEEGQMTVDKAPCDILAILSEVTDIFRPLAAQKTITLEKEFGTETCYVECDRDRVLQVFSNLVGNAIKFTGKGGRVRLRAHCLEGQEVLFSVQDNGPGISPEQIPHVFDRFWQAKKTAKLGTGLGLAIAKGIVAAHNGKLWVESELGKGTTFYFVLPGASTPSVVRYGVG